MFTALLACNPKSKTTQQNPNIILIYADDLGRGMLSSYGQKHLTTPNIDKLANEGMRFSNVYGCMFCAPARASLLNGMHDCHKQIWSLTDAGIYKELGKSLTYNQIEEKIHKLAPPENEGEVFLADVAKRQGYITAEFGKLEWGFATTAERVKSHGWDYHFGFYDHVRCHGFYPPFLFENGEVVSIEGNTHADCGKTASFESPEEYKKRWDMTGKAVYSDKIIMDKLLAFMENNNPQKTGQPFFIHLPSQLPHGPISVPEVHPELKNNKALTEFEKEYGTMVKILDEDVGKIYAKCKELGILENTIIIFTGDNGHEVYTRQAGKTEHGRATLDGGKFDDIHTKFYSEINGDVFDGNDGMAGLKRSNWEGGVRVPLIWYWKGKIKPGTQSDQLVANYDLLNTIAELTGGEIVKGKDSKSYAQTLLGNKSEEHKYTVFASVMGPAIVTNDGWKLRYYTRKKVFQLYNLKDDYREEKVLNARFPEKMEALKSILLKECDGDWKNGGYPKFSIIK